MVTDDSTDGRPWPIDPVRPSTPGGSPRPIPELAANDDPLGSLADFASAVDGAVDGTTHGTTPGNGTAPRAADGAAPRADHPDTSPAAPEASPSTVDLHGVEAVGDDDRTRYGLLLDRAAERGLLSSYDYQVRLGELAEATTIDQMKTIVTDLPALAVAPPATRSASSKRSSATALPGVGLAAVGGRRRASPWLLLGVLVLVVVASIVFFYVYAEHLVHTRGAGVIAAAARALSALRL